MSYSTEDLIEGAGRARREHRLAAAHRCLVRAVALRRQTGSQHELVRALKQLGQIERDLRYDEAARLTYEEAVAICRELSDPPLLAHTVRHLGDIHLHAGREELAEPCYREALELYRDSERTSPLDLANAIRPLAILKDNTGEVEEARRLWKEAQELYAALDVREGVTECSTRLARLRH